MKKMLTSKKTSIHTTQRAHIWKNKGCAFWMSDNKRHTYEVHISKQAHYQMSLLTVWSFRSVHFFWCAFFGCYIRILCCNFLLSFIFMTSLSYVALIERCLFKNGAFLGCHLFGGGPWCAIFRSVFRSRPCLYWWCAFLNVCNMRSVPFFNMPFLVVT